MRLVRAGVPRQFLLDLGDEARGAQAQQLGEVGDGVGERGGLPQEVDGEALVHALAQGVVVVVPHPLAHVAPGPEGEDLAVQGSDGLLRDVVGIEQPVGHRVELAPDHGAVGVGVDDHADLAGGGGAGDEVAGADDGLAVLHQVLEGVGLAQFRHPGLSLLVRLEAVGLEPLGEEQGALVAELRPGLEVDVQETLQAGEVLQGVGGEVGVGEVLRPRGPSSRPAGARAGAPSAPGPARGRRRGAPAGAPRGRGASAYPSSCGAACP